MYHFVIYHLSGVKGPTFNNLLFTMFLVVFLHILRQQGHEVNKGTRPNIFLVGVLRVVVSYTLLGHVLIYGSWVTMGLVFVFVTTVLGLFTSICHLTGNTFLWVQGYFRGLTKTLTGSIYSSLFVVGRVGHFKGNFGVPFTYGQTMLDCQRGTGVGQYLDCSGIETQVFHVVLSLLGKNTIFVFTTRGQQGTRGHTLRDIYEQFNTFEGSYFSFFSVINRGVGLVLHQENFMFGPQRGTTRTKTIFVRATRDICGHTFVIRRSGVTMSTRCLHGGHRRGLIPRFV